MTAFFATPEETEDWLLLEAERLHAFVHDELRLSGSRRSFLWPRDEPALPPPARGVEVWHPTATATVLSPGSTGWVAAGFHEHTARIGRRVSRSLTRSLRKRATVPLFAMSRDGTCISSKPAAWGTSAALSSGLGLRQFPDTGCWFVTRAATPRSTPAPPDDDRSLYEGDRASRAERLAYLPVVASSRAR